MERLFYIVIGFVVAVVLLSVFLVAKELLEDHRVKTELRAKAIADRTGREIKQNLCHYHIRDFDDRVNELIGQRLAEKEGENEAAEL